MREPGEESRLVFVTKLVTLSLVGAILGAALVEGLLRLGVRAAASKGNVMFWEPREDYGWNHPPLRSGWFASPHGEFRAWVQINSHGLRDIEHSWDKQPGTFRILLLGDSYLEAVQVNWQDTLPHLLEARLKEAGYPVEVINAAAASWGTDNELLYFVSEGHRYEPDLVLLAFTTANDVRETYAPMNRRAPRANLNKPFFLLDAAGNLRLFPSPVTLPKLKWYGHFELARLLSRSFPTLPLFSASDVHWPEEIERAPQPRGPLPMDMLVYCPPQPSTEEAWRLTLQLLGRLRSEVERRGARFAVFVVNGPWAHDENRFRFWFRDAPEEMAGCNPQRPNKTLGAFLWQEKIPSTDLFGPFEQRKGGAPLFFRIDPHWTPEGHKLAAEAVGRFLMRTPGLLPAQRGPVPE